MRDEQELENMLLKVAARPKGSESKQPAQRTSLPAQECSVDDDDDGEHGRKGKGLKVPLKKSFDGVEKDEEDGDGDGYQSELSYGRDLYEDEEDRRKLKSMSELQREMILHNRAEQREIILKTIRQMRRDRNEGRPSFKMRSLVRETSRSVKVDALNALVAMRQRAEDTDAKRLQESKQQLLSSKEESEAEGSSSGHSHQHKEDNDHSHQHKEEDNDHSHQHKEENNDDVFNKEEAEDVPSEEDEEEEGETEAANNDNKLWQEVPSDEYEEEEDEEEEDEEETEAVDDESKLMKGITIKRSKLVKWFMKPFFEDVIKGCFVRIAIGTGRYGTNIYRLCWIKNIDAKEPDKLYKFENKMTCKYLNCTWGDDSTAATWKMTNVSNQPPTNNEIKAWKQASDGHGITASEMKEKQEALSKANNYAYSAATVKQMPQEKKLVMERPLNIALEKDQLSKELAMAGNKGEHGEVERLQEKQKEKTYSLQHSMKNTKEERIEMMNRNNRIENLMNALELKPANPHTKAGEASYDPFSCRWTRSQNCYKSDTTKAVKNWEEGKADNEKPTDRVGDASVAGDNSVKKANMQTVTEKGAKLYKLHDFDLLTSALLTEQLGGAQWAPLAFMEHKRKLEARYVGRVENNEFMKKYKREERENTEQMRPEDYSKSCSLINALLPQPSWRLRLLLDNKDSLQVYLAAPKWKRVDPFFTPIRRRVPWPKRKPSERFVNWPVVPGIMAGMDFAKYCTALSKFRHNYQGSAERVVRECADYCQELLFLVNLDCYWDRGLPPLILDVNRPLQTDGDHQIMARLFYRAAFSSSQYIKMIEEWYANKFVQGMKIYLGPIPRGSKIRFMAFEAISRKIAKEKALCRKREDQARREVLEFIGV